MTITKKHVLGLMIIAISGLAFVFNNCSRVDAQDMPLQEAITDGASLPAAAADPAIEPAPLADHDEEVLPADSYVPTLEEQATVVQTAPPTTDPVPVTELIDHPDLFVVYQCPNSTDKVMICHFPQGSSEPNTMCVGHTAVSTHFGHVRSSYTYSDGSVHSITDYLGACRKL